MAPCCFSFLNKHNSRRIKKDTNLNDNAGRLSFGDLFTVAHKIAHILVANVPQKASVAPLWTLLHLGSDIVHKIR